MQLITIRPKNKISAFSAKAGEKSMVFQLFQPNAEKAYFPALPARMGTLKNPIQLQIGERVEEKIQYGQV